ncbi:MAG: hypothetical protein COT85_04475 [Chlamydiae bacterium CG10_big_fil_rev_8_21_14_0_10_42_34]|nr:MAG: hypothetical protein COT85_04475 [Chlamydiae bacterium CG10_big_fil_rev_8_21_14_0_10_42_34]
MAQINRNTWARILAKAWADEDFKKELSSRPIQVLKENGYDVPKDIKCTILVDTQQEKNLIIQRGATHFQYEGGALNNAWLNLIKKIYADENLKKQLMENPSKILSENGIPVSENLNYHIYEETENHMYLVIPIPENEGLSEEDLGKISGGLSACGGFCTDSSSG